MSKNDFYCIFLMKIDHFQHKNTEIFKIGQEIRELANFLIVQKWPLFEPKMFTVQWGIFTLMRYHEGLNNLGQVLPHKIL